MLRPLPEHSEWMEVDPHQKSCRQLPPKRGDPSETIAQVRLGVVLITRTLITMRNNPNSLATICKFV